jgi:hypothetical protein
VLAVDHPRSALVLDIDISEARLALLELGRGHRGDSGARSAVSTVSHLYQIFWAQLISGGSPEHIITLPASSP